MDLHIVGSRGIPAGYGGFETFAEKLSVSLVSRGHNVTVYCQLDPDEAVFVDQWNGVTRIGLPHRRGALGTIFFDLQTALIASRNPTATVLTLGYNTAIFSFIYRIRGVRHLLNMDGLEWKRKKWRSVQKAWLWLNEWYALHFADRLIADHPHIRRHLMGKMISRDNIVVIPYGADIVVDAGVSFVQSLGCESGKYFLVIARPEPENSILEIVQAFCAEPRAYPLVILGRYVPNQNTYHAEVMEQSRGANNILFPGAIHDPAAVAALRFHSLLYIHGHQVGGTNPSLVESLAAGCAVVAHDNQFNRWVAGPKAAYFKSVPELVVLLNDLPRDPRRLHSLREGSKMQQQRLFRQELIMQAYEDLLQFDQADTEIWELDYPAELPRVPLVNSGKEPCPGYFSFLVTENLWLDPLESQKTQPCARCGLLVRPRIHNGYWMPATHWNSHDQNREQTVSGPVL